MTPQDLGFPAAFPSFRPAQEEAIEYSLTSDKRFCGLGAPPGVGKSAIAYALARLFGGRTVILTATLGLQDQYMRDGFPGLVDIRGRANYPCWSGGNCDDGRRLDCKDKAGCPYLGAFRCQDASDIVITSYAYWLAVREMKPPDTLICDEAGLADQWLSRSLDFTITERECREAKLKFDPIPGDDAPAWLKLGPQVRIAAEARLLHVKASGRRHDERYRRDLKHAEGFVDRSSRIDNLDDNWVITREDGTDDGRLWRFECIWPGRYREKLFKYVPRVILMSATLRPKTLGLLGIKQSECDFKEWGRQFPAANGPVIWVPTVRMNHKIGPQEEQRWIERIREIKQARADRKGLIHSVSYARAKRIANELKGHIVLNGAADPETQSARQAFDRHIHGPKDSVLVSPSFGTGWDFAGKAAEYQIIAKLPIPDTRSKVMQARVGRDRSYADYLAAQELVQSCGRPVRSATDRGESLIVDDAWNWFRVKGSEHLPKWFKVRKEEQVPEALPLL